MEDPPWDIEKMSVLISRLLERTLIGTREMTQFRRRAILIHECISNSSSNDFSVMFTGSKSEGLSLFGSDNDFMYVDNHVVAVYPGQSVHPEDDHKTVLYVREAECRPGYVTLQLGRIGLRYDHCLLNSLVPVGNVTFVSSDMYREQIVNELTIKTGVRHTSNGPSSSTGDMDYVSCFHLNSWPKEADQWVSRPRLYGWPTQALVNQIVHSGCHLVPVGDKCSEDTLLQWRISFASAERLLVHSFSHMQLQMYCLLKYFLKQMKDMLRDIIGKEDDDILCSYHLKTLLFISIENSNPELWQERNLFHCFWFCLNILISCVRMGHFPNYFIPSNNLFQRKVHGINQQILLDILNTVQTKKFMCLSQSGPFSDVTILQCVCNSEIQTELMCRQSVQEIEYRQDMDIKRTLEKQLMPLANCTPHFVTRSINAEIKSRSEQDEITAFATTVNLISQEAKRVLHQDMRTGSINNKTRYRTLRKYQHRLTLCSSMGTYVLDLATLHFLTGSYLKANMICCHITSQPSYFTNTCNFLPQKQADMYMQQYCGKEFTPFHKLKNTFTNVMHLHKETLHLPHLRPEISRSPLGVLIPPLPYAAFLSFLCCHELKDRMGCDAALRKLIVAKYDERQGGQRHWIVHTLVGICYQILGDYPRAISAFLDSLQTESEHCEYNAAFERIAALQRKRTD